jgi:hypothetical protein
LALRPEKARFVTKGLQMYIHETQFRVAPYCMTASYTDWIDPNLVRCCRTTRCYTKIMFRLKIFDRVVYTENRVIRFWRLSDRFCPEGRVCQMAYLHTKNVNFGTYILVYFVTIWYF